MIVNVNKQKDALKKNGITVDGVHYAVRFKGKFHIIINKVFFSTMIFNPNACMYIDHSFQKFIATVILDLKALYFLLEQIGKANLKLGKRGTEVDRLLLYLQSIEGMWIHSKSLSQQILLCRF